MIRETNRLPVLETERLRLTPLTAADSASVFALMGDPETLAHRDRPENDDPDLVAEMVRIQAAENQAGRAAHWGMRPLDDDRLVGLYDLSEIDRRHRRAQVGFLLGGEAWDRGYAPEALRAVIGYAAASGLRRIMARAHVGARRSETLLEALGFEPEGLLRGHVLRAGERRDCRLFALLL